MESKCGWPGCTRASRRRGADRNPVACGFARRAFRISPDELYNWRRNNNPYCAGRHCPYNHPRMKTALITGITGQDGSYLAELLVDKGYEVHGIVRRVALEDPEHRLARLAAVRDRVILHAASLESYASVYQVIAKIAPDECYHLAAQSFVSYSF